MDPRQITSPLSPISAMIARKLLVWGRGVWRPFKWTPWSLSGIFENLRELTTPRPPHLVSCTKRVWPQKNIYPPIFRNFHRISLCTKWFWPWFCHTLLSLVHELPIISNFYEVLEGQPKKTINNIKNNNYENDEVMDVFF